MSAFFDTISTLWNQILYVISQIKIHDILDILLVAFIVYKAIELFRDSRAGTLLKGIAILLVVSLVAQWFNMVTMRWLLNKVIDSVLIAIVVIFQPELRRAVERIGRSKISQIGRGSSYGDERDAMMHCIDAVCKAAASMQEQKIGALMVFERTTMLGEIINTGTVINANATPQLVGNIFYPKSPLHDGAMILREGRVYAAGCILPLTGDDSLSSQLGTRHRAAIGMSENSDALVVVVSEETGTISVALNGKIQRDFTPITLRGELNRQLLPADEKSGGKAPGLFKKMRRKKKQTPETQPEADAQPQATPPEETPDGTNEQDHE